MRRRKPTLHGVLWMALVILTLATIAVTCSCAALDSFGPSIAQAKQCSVEQDTTGIVTLSGDTLGLVIQDSRVCKPIE